MSKAPAWACQHSVDVDVPVAFAWQYMTGVRDGFGPNLEPGMQRIADLMTTAWRRDRERERAD